MILAVAVSDTRGMPWPEAVVEASIPGLTEALRVVTDAQGIAVLEVPEGARPGGDIAVRVSDGSYVVDRAWKAGDAVGGETLFVEIPVRGPEAILTPTEIGGLAVGGAAAALGYGFHLKPLEMLGELVFGAIVFTVIYRHSC